MTIFKKKGGKNFNESRMQEVQLLSHFPFCAGWVADSSVSLQMSSHLSGLPVGLLWGLLGVEG